MSTPERHIHDASAEREEILARLQDLLKDILKLESTESLIPSARFREDLNMDSLAMVDIILMLEDGFGLKLPSDMNVLGAIQTVGDVVDLVMDISKHER
jgi:acyl carrier protein